MNFPLDLKFQHLTADAWKGKLAIVHTRSNSFECDPITEWLDSEGRHEEYNKSSLSITCRAKGNYTSNYYRSESKLLLAFGPELSVN